MIALISIPHQTPPRIDWYGDVAHLMHEAERHAEEHSDGNIHKHGFGSPAENAAHELADDWHGKILVRNAEDIEAVRAYTGHQEHRIRAMVDELEAEFTA